MKHKISGIGYFIGACMLLIGAMYPVLTLACVRSPIKSQKALMMHLGASEEEAVKPPREYWVEVGTMISILLPENTKVIQTDTNGESMKLAQQLEEKAYQNVMKRWSGRSKYSTVAREPVELRDKQIQAMVESGHLSWFHFFAGKEAKGYLHLINDKASRFIRLEVARKAPSPPTPTRVDSSEQRIYYRDKTLLLDVPGAIGSEWRLQTSNGTASILSLRGSDVAGRVTMEVAIEPTEREMSLTITNSAASYALELRPRSVPKC
jgi:hypothetical protein